MSCHELKIDTAYFKKLKDGSKLFEIRRNDRGFSEGDKVYLHEVANGIYTNDFVSAEIGFVCQFEQKDGYVVFSLLNVK